MDPAFRARWPKCPTKNPACGAVDPSLCPTWDPASDRIVRGPVQTLEHGNARLKAIVRNYEYWTNVKHHIQQSSKTAAVTQNPDSNTLLQVPQSHNPLIDHEGASDDAPDDSDGVPPNDNSNESKSAKKDSPILYRLDDFKRPLRTVQYKTPLGRAVGKLPSKGRQSLACVNITGMRCSVTNAAGPAGIQAAHIIGSATPDGDISNMEGILGIVEGGFKLNTPLHELFDKLLIIIVPSLRELKDMIRTFRDTLDKRGNADIQLAGSLLATIPPALHGHVYEYSFLPLDAPDHVHDWHKLVGRYRLEPDPIEEIRQAKAIADKDKRRSHIAHCRCRGYRTVSPLELDHICLFNDPVPMLSQAIPALFALDAARKVHHLEQAHRDRNLLSEIRTRYNKHSTYAEDIVQALLLLREIYALIERAESREDPSNDVSQLQRRRNPPRDARPDPSVLEEDHSSDIDLDDDDYALYLDEPDDHLQAPETESPIAVPGTHDGGPKPHARGAAFSSSLSPLSSTSSDEDGHDIQPAPSTPMPARFEAGSRDLSSSPSILSLPTENRLTPSDEPRGGFGNPTSSFTAGLQAPIDQPNFDAPSSDRNSASPPAHPGSPSTTYSAPYRAQHDDNADGYDALGGPSTGDAVTVWSDHAAGKRRREFTPDSDSDIARELEAPTRTPSPRSDLPALKKTKLE
ncbi:hypothetical protein FISHEDRAFT_78781 [Fistulina hepatica ATCC 64428]|uniref:Uncharacterized protein n=1 Tax=Fistulina hepatica ATCC 64428 TaxID=1128425 RepID=A0A0D7A2G1_9AGAR|nr:hypothetical protein FISHEDRAFT_78781 [Fistulina hepatica ATCC 64428]